MAQLSIACNRPKGGELGRVLIKTPSNPAVSSQSLFKSTLSDFPRACFLVNVTGEGIQSTNTNCRPTVGISTAWIGPQSTAELIIPAGSKRDFTVYLYLIGHDEACPATFDETSTKLNRLYRVGQLFGQPIVGGDNYVNLTYSFPGLFNHLGKSGELPTSCLDSIPVADRIVPGEVAMGVLNGQNHRIIKTQITDPLSNTTAIGTKFKIVKDVQTATVGGSQ